MQASRQYTFTQCSQLTSTPRSLYDRPEPDEVCVRFVTQGRNNQHRRLEALPITLNSEIIIGRNPALCTYIIDDLIVSNIHCRIRVTQSDDGNLIVSCEDTSMNGVFVNGDRMRKTCILLMDNDILEIPHVQIFRCEYVFKRPPPMPEHLFDVPATSMSETLKIDDFLVLPHCLGSGAFAKVHLAIWPQRATQVACKTIKLPVPRGGKGRRSPGSRWGGAEGDAEARKQTDVELKKLMKERDILMSLSHPNIIRVYAAIPNYQHNFLHIFLQLCTGGDLFTYLINHIRPRGHLIEGEAKYLVYQLFQALSYLHDKNIAHRDLKPENILLYTPGSYPRIFIADFGLARSHSTEATFTVCGTVAYLPPEAVSALDGREQQSVGLCSMPSDCWSAGVLMFIMLAGHHPFDRRLNTWATYRCVYGSAGDEVYRQYGNCTLNSTNFDPDTLHNDQVSKWRIKMGTTDIDFWAGLWESMSDAQELVRGLLTEDPKERFTCEDALESAWIQSEAVELEKAWNRMASQAQR